MTDDQEFLIHRQPWVLFRTMGHLLSVPIATVEQMVPKGKLHALPGAGDSFRSLMKHRDATLTVLDLRGVLVQSGAIDVEATPGSSGPAMSAENTLQTVIVLNWNRKRMGLVVDTLVGVEPLPKRSHGIMQVAPGLRAANTPVNGFALRGDSGELVLLVDVEWLLDGREATGVRAGAA